MFNIDLGVYSASSNLMDRIRSIVTYVCTYLWAISFILLIFIVYASLRGPFNVIHSFNSGKHRHTSFLLFSFDYFMQQRCAYE
jgi:hypothetical protein